jgi:hypothetical protein
MQIIIEMDKVTIEGQTVNRPSGISRSRWMHFWEKVKVDNGLDGFLKRQRY